MAGAVEDKNDDVGAALKKAALEEAKMASENKNAEAGKESETE